MGRRVSGMNDYEGRVTGNSLGLADGGLDQNTFALDERESPRFGAAGYAKGRTGGCLFRRSPIRARRAGALFGVGRRGGDGGSRLAGPAPQTGAVRVEELVEQLEADIARQLDDERPAADRVAVGEIAEPRHRFSHPRASGCA